MPRIDDDEYYETPPVVVGAVSVGTVPLPFLAVYAVLFTLHGWLHPVHPPDITSTQGGELVAGLIAIAAFVAVSIALWQFLNRRRRWPFAVLEAGVAGVSIWFLTDSTKGGPAVSVLILAGAVISLVLGFAPDAWSHVGRRVPSLVTRLYRAVPGLGARELEQPVNDTSRLAGSSEPTMVEPSSLRRGSSSG